MASFNKTIIQGNLGSDPELRYTQGGTAVCEVSLALNNRRKGQNDQWIDETVWVGVVFWARSAEILCEYCKKGSSVLVEGRLSQDNWTDQTTGAKRSKTKVTCEKLVLQGGGKGANDGARGARDSGPPSDDGPPANNNVQAPGPDEDIPF